MASKLASLVVLVALAASLAIACGDDEEPEQDEAANQVCDSLQTVGDSLDDLRGAENRDDFDAARDETRSAFEELADDLGGLAAATADALQDAFNTLLDDISDLPEGSSFDDAREAAEPGIDGLRTAITTAAGIANCDD